MSGIEVKWKKMGNEFTYDVLYAKDANGPWIRGHDYRLTDDGVDSIIVALEDKAEDPASAPYNVTENNVFVINGLREKEKYFIKVIAHDKYDYWWYSYNSPLSLGGGFSLDSRPVPDGKNIVGFQFNVVI